MQLTITAGKRYVTRSGKQVRIYATDGSGDFPIHGAIQRADGWSIEEWTIDGFYRMDAKQSSLDITFEIADNQTTELA